MQATVQFGSEVTDGAAFFQRCMRAAAALQAAGIVPGDVVALLLRNEPLVLEVVLAARWLGARWCPINWHFKTAEVAHILGDSGAQLLVAHSDLLREVAAGIPGDVRVLVAQPHPYILQSHGETAAVAGDVSAESWVSFREQARAPVAAAAAPGSAMIYTSGTTGLPKGIRRQPGTPEQVAQLAASTRRVLGMGPGMRALISAPLYHSAPGSYLVQAALNNAHLVIEPRFDAVHTLQLIQTLGISHLYLVPTMFVRLLRLPTAQRQAFDASPVRYVASTGSPCPPEIKHQMMAWWGPVFHESYAASELGWVTHIDSHEAARKPGSAGRALAGVLLKVLSAQGDELPPGQVGLLYSRDPAVPDFTYANNDAARRKLERAGLWSLGDMGYLDDEGYLFIVDRQADMVISGGVNIYPAEVEAQLTMLPGVADCAVFGIPDDEFGEVLAAAVQMVGGVPQDPSALQSRLQARLRERIAAYKVPRLFTFHDTLPREDTGKIFKRKLREPYWVGRQRRV